ncbi:hypothetical protein AVEN_100987-1 [Araneus ventricosus]|uniref:PHD-type domain-containing protein n=1 Tax=Araneus ventricosus TaxID=182803 RepID=A0A4Y2JG36_ARAVE|nr:hypothetical protein AVEN_100987-1 [Araneus ventricosus]
MKAKMELKSEEEKREGGEETHCIICAETSEEDWNQCRISEDWVHENCADLEGNNLFYESDVYFTKIWKHRMHLSLKELLSFQRLITF